MPDTLPAENCWSMVVVDSPRFAGEHMCNLSADHQGAHTDGTINWIGGSAWFELEWTTEV